MLWCSVLAMKGRGVSRGPLRACRMFSRSSSARSVTCQAGSVDLSCDAFSIGRGPSDEGKAQGRECCFLVRRWVDTRAWYLGFVGCHGASKFFLGYCNAVHIFSGHVVIILHGACAVSCFIAKQQRRHLWLCNQPTIGGQ